MFGLPIFPPSERRHHPTHRSLMAWHRIGGFGGKGWPSWNVEWEYLLSHPDTRHVTFTIINLCLKQITTPKNVRRRQVGCEVRYLPITVYHWSISADVYLTRCITLSTLIVDWSPMKNSLGAQSFPSDILIVMIFTDVHCNCCRMNINDMLASTSLPSWTACWVFPVPLCLETEGCVLSPTRDLQPQTSHIVQWFSLSIEHRVLWYSPR